MPAIIKFLFMALMQKYNYFLKTMFMCGVMKQTHASIY